MKKELKLANILLQSACPNNVILEDERGNPSVMIRIPKMSYADLGLGSSNKTHPAFIINGKEVNALYVSKYGNIVCDGCALSLPGEDPIAKIGLYDASAACRAKGRGWHLMTKAEWAVIAQRCVQLGALPKGNNVDGKDFRETMRTATVLENGHTLTGTGPASWFHDGTFAGIADLNGNTSNWMGGIRFVCGELQILENNNGADNSHYLDENDEWKAIDGTTGSLITPDGTGTTAGSLKLDFVYDTNKTCRWQWVTGAISNSINNSRNSEFADIRCDADVCEAARELLWAYGLLPASSNPLDYEFGKLHCRNTGEDMRMHCGGSFHDGVDSGLYFIRICDTQDHATAGIGFRCAYAEV